MSFKTLSKVFLCLIISFQPYYFTHSQPIQLDLEPEHRPQIRSSYSKETCITLFCPQDFNPENGKVEVSDSVGIPIGNGTVEDFEKAITEIIKNYGIEKLIGTYVFIAGADINSERELKLKHKEVLKKHNLENHIKIKVISMQKEEIHGLTLKSTKAILQRVKLWFPSIKRDFEKPDKNEVIAGLVTTAVIETGSIYYLFQTLPEDDAIITSTLHAVILSAYAVYTKFMINWLLRPGTNMVEGFLKQLSMSLPFILNYNIFGQFTPIVKYLESHTIEVTMLAFPNEVIEFASTQSVTMMLQTLFYYVVITRVIGSWANNQQGLQRSKDARVYRKIAEMPVLAMDAIIIAIASGVGAEQLISLGPIELNDGHAMLLTLTALSSSLYKIGLNSSFEVYNWLNHRATPKVLDFFRDQMAI
ncbi:MAG: hypothetical protein KDD58_12560, partial [Bdellovibrionales bacterium]|nr:hypothetical protein [Bdellovibrionales bacterium]